MKSYQVLIDRQAYQKAIDYLEKLKTGSQAGGYLQDRLNNLSLDRLNETELIELLTIASRSYVTLKLMRRQAMILAIANYLVLSRGIMYLGLVMIFIRVSVALMMG